MTNAHDVNLKSANGNGHIVNATVNSLPSQSHTLLDFSKVAIGFVSLIMGFSITFLGGDITGLAKNFLLGTWGLLIVTAILSCLTIACVANDSIKDRLSRRGTAVSNLSFFALVLSLISFSMFGYFRTMAEKPTSLSGIASDFLKLAAAEPQRLSEVNMSDGRVSFAIVADDQRFRVSIEKTD
jgi:hypothetical protein